MKVTDENVRPDGASVKCRHCDTVIYFKHPPPGRRAGNGPDRFVSVRARKTLKKVTKEYRRSLNVNAKQVLKEEKRGQERPVRVATEHDIKDGYKDTEVKVSSSEVTKTDAPSTIQSIFDNIAKKLEKLSIDDSASKYNFSTVNFSDKTTRRIILIIVVGILLTGLLTLVFPKLSYFF